MPIFAVWNEYTIIFIEWSEKSIFFNLHLRSLLKFCNCKNDVSRFSVTVSRPYMIDDVMRIKMAIQ